MNSKSFSKLLGRRNGTFSPLKCYVTSIDRSVIED